MLDKLKDIVKNHQCETLKWSDGKCLVDVQTANVVISLHDALVENASKELLESKINESLKSFKDTVRFAWSKV